MYAVLEAAKLFPGNEMLEILTDSKYVIKSLIGNLRVNEDKGYIGIANKELLQLTVAALRNRQGITSFQWVKGHQGNQMNEEADLLAGLGSDKNYPTQLNLEVNVNGGTSEAKLQALNQATVYRGIREARLATAKHRREATKSIIKTIQAHMSDSNGEAPNEAQIWRATKHKDFSRQMRYFLWMAIHYAYKIRKYWTLMIGGEYADRGLCRHCNNAIEDMPHILTQCQTPGQAEVWEMAKELWIKKGHEWRQPWIGDILACRTRMIKNDMGETQHGDMRFWRILVAESAYLIWKLRCARVIQDGNNPITQVEVRNKWRKAMNERLDLDRKMTHKRHGKRAIKTGIVLETWKEVLKNEHELPKDWIDSSGVLVGSDQHTHRENG
ncbi:hypothetical protein BDN71DRAFT_1396724 [Pleurotus eryngii]|uniref:RNase H type-1 domain-containing protein n=1 Tax=Pleurotus eryngii TaxID=5323 RepID=A0A9P5ZR38_PLEER|nr:hypothetical protein BDN71DRAFT_1396724 [Pleurotus eryngii]